VNPSLTIAANALRVGAAVVGSWPRWNPEAWTVLISPCRLRRNSQDDGRALRGWAREAACLPVGMESGAEIRERPGRARLFASYQETREPGRGRGRHPHPALLAPRADLGRAGRGKHVVVESRPFLRAAISTRSNRPAQAGRQVLSPRLLLQSRSSCICGRELASGVIGDVLFLCVNALRATGRRMAATGLAGGGAPFRGRNPLGQLHGQTWASSPDPPAGWSPRRARRAACSRSSTMRGGAVGTLFHSGAVAAQEAFGSPGFTGGRVPSPSNPTGSFSWCGGNGRL
jgi:hypothetical protein